MGTENTDQSMASGLIRLSFIFFQRTFFVFGNYENLPRVWVDPCSPYQSVYSVVMLFTPLPPA